jgi:tetratricopeptide (TPR) repeat protein
MRKPTLAAGILFILIAGAGFCAAGTPAAPSGLESAIQFYQGKLKADPYDFITAATLGGLYAGRARASADINDYGKAESCFRLSLALMPKNNLDAASGLAAALSSQHRFKEAWRIIEPALAEAASHPQLWALAGDVQFELGNYSQAENFYALYAERKPGLTSWSRLAKARSTFGRLAEAEKLWQRCLALPVGPAAEPFAWARVMVGEIHLQKGEFADARQLYEEATAILPDYPLALEHLAEVEAIEGNRPEALKLCRKAVQLSPDPGLLVFLGSAFEKAGLRDSATAVRKKAERSYLKLLAQGQIGCLRPLALFYLDRGINPEKALELAQRDLAVRQDFGAYLTLGRAYLQSGKKKEALEAIRRVSPLAENDPQFCYYAGEIYLANGKKGEAERLFRKTLELSPAFEKLFGVSPGERLSLVTQK